VLLERGADPHVGDARRIKPVHLAAVGGHAAVTRMLLERTPQEAGLVLQVAAGKGHETLVRDILKRGVHPNVASAKGRTALHQAAQHGRQLAVRALLAAGASPDARDAWGNTALHLAARHNHANVERALLEGGARYDIGHHWPKGYEVKNRAARKIQAAARHVWYRPGGALQKEAGERFAKRQRRDV
jgi:ankyrin repeat protein